MLSMFNKVYCDEPLPSASPDVHAFLARAQQALTDPQARSYLSRRGISLEIARQTGLGFALRGTWLNPRGAGQPRIVAPLTAPAGPLLIRIYSVLEWALI